VKIVSINVAMPVEVEHRGKPVSTGIFKTPVSGPVEITHHNLAGDGQADLENHGGENKAVYAYSADHYAYWQQELRLESLPCGQFGENLTVAGLDEVALCIGDRLRAGTALLTITQPRVPCYKLGIRFEDKQMPKKFTRSARTGVYLKVLETGAVNTGDSIEVLSRGLGELPVKRLFEAYFMPCGDESVAVLEQALEIPELSAEWRAQLEQRLAGND